MLQVAEKRKSRVGLPPGALVFTGEQKADEVVVTAMDYDAATCLVRDVATTADIAEFASTPQTTWIDVVGLHEPAIIEQIGNLLRLHPMIMEDILDPDQRPKYEDLDEQLLIIVKAASCSDGTGRVDLDQISIVLGETYVVTFRERDTGLLGPIRSRIEAAQGRVRAGGPAYLTYRIIDAVVDGYFRALEEVETPLERLQDEVITNPSPSLVHEIHHLKQAMIQLRRAVWPVREVIMGIQRRDSRFVPDAVEVYLRDLHDHSVQVIETIETFREILSSVLDTYLSSTSNRLNEVMKVLTVISTIFMPLSFLAGVFGMNFKHFPELGWWWAYPLGFWVLCVSVTVLMMIVLRRRRWL